MLYLNIAIRNVQIYVGDMHMYVGNIWFQSLVPRVYYVTIMSTRMLSILSSNSHITKLGSTMFSLRLV